MYPNKLQQRNFERLKMKYYRNCLRCAHNRQTHHKQSTLGLLHRKQGPVISVTPLDGSTNLIQEYAVLRISDKQQLEILVLMALYVPCITAHRHTTIVINETVAKSSVGPIETRPATMQMATE